MKKLLAVGVVLTLALAGCSGASKADAPEPEPANIRPLANIRVFQMPDGFRNVAWGCNGKVGVYVTSRGIFESGNADASTLPSSISTVLNDPNCP